MSRRAASAVCPYGGASCFECPLPDCKLAPHNGIYGSNLRKVNMTGYEQATWDNDATQEHIKPKEEGFFEKQRHFEFGNL